MILKNIIPLLKAKIYCLDTNSCVISLTRQKAINSEYLSDIIGFSEVTKTKDVLRKAFNAIKSEIKTQNFEAQINNEKQTLIAKIGAAVSQENNLFEKINEIIEPLKTGITVSSIEDIDKVLNHIKKPANTKQTNRTSIFRKHQQSTFNHLKVKFHLLTENIKNIFQSSIKLPKMFKA